MRSLLRHSEDAVRDVANELTKATERFPAFNSPHEGWAVIREELDELWEHVKANTATTFDARSEAIQVAAMALRFAVDLCSDVEYEADGTPSAALCSCGHTAFKHVMFSQQQRCEATVHTNAPLGGGSIFPCACRQFEAA